VAKEMMSSEAVFVGVLRLLNVELQQFIQVEILFKMYPFNEKSTFFRKEELNRRKKLFQMLISKKYLQTFWDFR